MASAIKVYRKANPTRLMFTVPNGGVATVDDPGNSGFQWYQLDSPDSKLTADIPEVREGGVVVQDAEIAPTGRERFAAAKTPREKLLAVAHGVSGATIARFSGEDVALLVAAWAEFAGVGL